MKVIVHAVDKYACGHYRSIWPAEALMAQGHDVQIVRNGEPRHLGGLIIDGEVVGVSGAGADADVVVFQRPARKIIADMIPVLRRQGVAVVVDMDDDLERIHPSNPAYRGVHPKHREDYNWEHAKRACRDATMVTVSTPALLPRYASHGRGALLRNMIPERFLQLPHDGKRASVGWAGSVHSHPGDLDQITSILDRLSREGHDVKFVGLAEKLAEKIGATCTGEIEFDDWMLAVASLGVGLAPLAGTSFNECKSWLKPLEYSAVGVPWVASPTPEYQLLANKVGAPTASKPKEWYRELKTLLTDDGRREEASYAAREAVACLTIEKNAYLWAEAWEEALKMERKAART